VLGLAGEMTAGVDGANVIGPSTPQAASQNFDTEARHHSGRAPTRLIGNLSGRDGAWLHAERLFCAILQGSRG
jgi:hypothetical protein